MEDDGVASILDGVEFSSEVKIVSRHVGIEGRMVDVDGLTSGFHD